MLPVWRALEQHVEEWSETTPASNSESITSIFDQRKEKCFYDEFYAAYVVDPINFKHTPGPDGGRWTAPKLSESEVSKALDVFYRLSECRTEQQKQQLKREFASCRLSIPTRLADFMPALTISKQGDAMSVPSVQLRREFLREHAADTFPLLAKSADKLIGMHVTTCASERNWSVWGKVYTKDRNRLSLSLGEKIVYIRGNLSTNTGSDEEVVAQLFTS